jgi:transcriptional regulator with PAS, ATPase and Fis domain
VADKGTVFLDEIGDMSLRLQAKLLRVIEEKEMTRLGSTRTVKLDIRILSATNQDLQGLIAQKKFRQDLFFRLNTIFLSIPPLSERTEDIMPLVHHFTALLNKRYHMEKKFVPQAAQFLMMYISPGCKRNCRHSGAGLSHSKSSSIKSDDLPFHSGVSSIRRTSWSTGEQILQRDHQPHGYRVLKRALEKYGSTHKAARNLKISQSTIVRKMKKLNMKVG